MTGRTITGICAGLLATALSVAGAQARRPPGVDGARVWLDDRSAAEGWGSFAVAHAPRRDRIWTAQGGDWTAQSPVVLQARPFVVWAVLAAEDEGLLGRSDAVDGWLPDAPGARGTVEDLLDDGDPASVRLAARVLEEAVGQPWERWVEDRAMRALGLQHTSLLAPEGPRPSSTRLLLGQGVGWTPPGVDEGPLAVSTVRDLGRLCQRLVAGQGEPAQAILAHDGGSDHLGWAPLDLDGTPALGLDATTLYGHASLVLVPREEFATLVVTDSRSAWDLATDEPLAASVVRLLLGGDPPPRPPAASQSLQVGLAILGGWALLLGSLVWRVRRGARRPEGLLGWASWGALGLAEAAIPTSIVAVTVNNPDGADAWRGLWALQPDLCVALAGTALILGTSAVARILIVVRAPRG